MGGRSSAKRTGRLYPRRNHFQRLSRPQGTWFRRGEPRKKSPLTPPGTYPGTVRLITQCLNHYATPCPQRVHSKQKLKVLMLCSLLLFRAPLNKVTCAYILLCLDFKYPLMVMTNKRGSVKRFSV